MFHKKKGYILLWVVIWQSLIIGIVTLCFEEVIEQQRMNRLFQRQLSAQSLDTVNHLSLS